MIAESNNRLRLEVLLCLIVLMGLVASGLRPYDRLTWFLEIAPILLLAPVLFISHRRFPLTSVLCILITLHALVLCAGGAYTYARVPLGNWLQDYFALARNPYDRIGHFMQGFVPALAAREILLRHSIVRGRRMAGFLAICVAMSVSAMYELLEWWSALLLGQGADEFLGTQGDQWDTQWDMFMALLGASTMAALLPRLHDQQIASMEIATRHAKALERP